MAYQGNLGMTTIDTSRSAIPDLADLVEQTERTELSPLAFFVSWHGVLTIAYRLEVQSLQHDHLNAAYAHSFC